MYLKTRDQLLDLMRSFISGTAALHELEAQFSALFVRRVSFPLLDPDHAEFFGGEVFERINWTAKMDLPEQDRAYGWIDEQQLRVWMRHALERYERNREVTSWDDVGALKRSN